VATKKQKRASGNEAHDKGKISKKEPPKPDSSRGEELVAWTVRPMQSEPRKAKIFVASTVAFLALVYFAYRELLWVVFTAFVIVTAFNSFVFPSRYRLTTLGVEQKAGLINTFKPWSSIAGVAKFKDGVQLNHGRGKMRNRLNPGMFVYFGEDNSSEILRIVEQYVNQG